MARKMIDCRESASEKPCSLMMSGEEEEVIRAATEHVVSFHGEKNTPELRQQIRNMLKDEPSDQTSSETQRKVS